MTVGSGAQGAPGEAMGSLSAMSPASSLCHSAWAQVHGRTGASCPLVLMAGQAFSLGSRLLQCLCLLPVWVRRSQDSVQLCPKSSWA